MSILSIYIKLGQIPVVAGYNLFLLLLTFQTQPFKLFRSRNFQWLLDSYIHRKKWLHFFEFFFFWFLIFFFFGGKLQNYVID